jgi:hypothetical protein
MNFIKKLLIFTIIVILFISLWILLKRRQEIKYNIENFSISKSLSSDPLTAELNNVAITDVPVSITSINPNYANLTLKEYCIKGAYNAAYSGSFINLDMINYVVSRGCRLLDFEVYYVNENNMYIPKVAYTTDSKFQTFESENSILLDDVLARAVNAAFSTSCPNSKDPLFINLRIKSNNNLVYKAVAKSVDNTLESVIYKNKDKSHKITDSTKLVDIMGKVILMVDKTINRNYTNFTACNNPRDSTCYDLTNYISIESGNEYININKYNDVFTQCTTPITILNDNISTSAKRVRLVFPDIVGNNNANPDINQMISKYGCQWIPFRYYINDSGLKDYERFFNGNLQGIVPLNMALPYFDKINNGYS